MQVILSVTQEPSAEVCDAWLLTQTTSPLQHPQLTDMYHLHITHHELHVQGYFNSGSDLAPVR